MSLIPPGVRAVFFDAVGTLLWPEPAAEAVYATIGRALGSRLSDDEIAHRFTAAFRCQEQIDAQHGHRTSEEREMARWRAIVAEVFDDIDEPEGCFQALYDHFARQTAWRVEPHAAEIIARLRDDGLVVGMASNFDRRLRGLAAGLPELAQVGPLAISSEIGWKKPAPAFFHRACEAAGALPEEALLVGDDWENDVQGARRAGLHAVWVSPRARPGEGARELRELLDNGRG